MEKAILNWSGGKDSSLCLFYVLKYRSFDIKYLFTSISEEYQRISMHGVRVALLEKQAKSLKIPLFKMMLPEVPSMTLYDQQMEKHMQNMAARGIRNSIFGDIFLEDLRIYREKQLTKVEMEGVFPLWKRSTTYLLNQFISLGFKAVVVCVNQKYLDQTFVGREIDKNFQRDLPKDVDPCGENGEFHSFVYDGPIFSYPIKWERGEIIFRKYEQQTTDSIKDDDRDACNSEPNFDTGFWYCDLV